MNTLFRTRHFYIIILSFLACFSFAHVPSAHADVKTISPDYAEKMVKKMGDTAISSLTNPSLSLKKRKKNMKAILDTYFSVKTIGRFALGTHWRSATDVQKTKYLKLFEETIINTYTSRFKDYSNQDFKVSGSTYINKRDIMIHSKIISTDPDAPNELSIDWRIRFKKGKYRVVDVIIEDISMGITQRSDFAAVIRKDNGNIETLLTSLKERNEMTESKKTMTAG